MVIIVLSMGDEGISWDRVLLYRWILQVRSTDTADFVEDDTGPEACMLR